MIQLTREEQRLLKTNYRDPDILTGERDLLMEFFKSKIDEVDQLQRRLDANSQEDESLDWFPREMNKISDEYADHLIYEMRTRRDNELNEYADQYEQRLNDIRAHSKKYEDDVEVQEELMGDYKELIKAIRRELSVIRRRVFRKS